MAHSLSWIDPAEFDVLVEATAWRRPQPRPAAVVSPVAAAADHTDGNEGEVLDVGQAAKDAPHPDAPVASARPTSRPTRSVTVAARPKPPAAPAVPPPPQFTPAPAAFTPPVGAGVEERLEHLIAWATEQAGLHAATVIDDEGLLIAGAQPSSQAATDSALAHTCTQSRWVRAIGAEQSGQLTVRTRDETHVLVWEPSQRGRLLLSLRGRATPSPAVLAALGAALRGAL